MADTFDYDKLAKAIKRGSASDGPGLGLGSKPEDFKKALDVSKEALLDFGKKASNSLDVWRDLSKTGAAFSNDVIGMSTAAAQSRMSLDDFSKVIRDNGKQLTGLGGSVGRGAEVFAKLSKSFFDSNMDRGLRELGYTSKELNDVLVLTAGAQKSSFSDTKEGQKRTNEAAASMAKEMDLIAKLTGKSRAEQMEEMTKRKVDGQAEAKLRLLTAGKSEEEAAAIRLEYQKGLLEAQKQGTEQSYKEFFATGTYLSEEAATQAALLGKQARAQEESIKAMQGGDFVKAAEARERSASEGLKNQSDKTILTLATFGSAAGSAGEIATKNVEVNDALYHSVSKVKAEYEKQTGTMISYSEALKIARDKAVAEQQGKDKEGKPKSGATEGLIAIEKAQQDFKAGLAGAAEAVNKDGKSLANALRDTGTAVKNVIKEIEGTAQGGNIGKNIRQRAEAGQRNEAPVIPPGTGKLKADEIKRDAGGGVVGDVTRLASDAANKGIGVVAEAAGSMVGPNNPIGPMQSQGGRPLEARAVGGPVDAGTPYLVGEGGKAEIFVPKSAGDIVPMDKVGTKLPPPPDPKEQMSFAESMAASVRKGMQTVGVDPNMRGNPTGGMDGFNLSSISKDISTTFSSVTGGGSSTKQRTQSDDSKTAEKELKSVKEQYAAEREILLKKTKEQLGPDAGSRQIRNAMRDGEEGKALEEKYKALISPLEKQIEDGIKWEVSTKESAIEETEKILSEQRLILKMHGAEQLAITEFNEEEKKKALTITSDEISSAMQELLVTGRAVSEETIKNLGTVDDSEMGGFASNQSFGSVDDSEMGGFASNQSFGSVDDSEMGGFATVAPPKPVAPPDLNALNLPGFGNQLRAGAASIPASVKKDDAEKKQKEEAEKARAAEKSRKDAEAAKPTATPAAKGATLDDLLKSLDMLNKQMGQLIGQQDNLMRKQERNMKAALSTNVQDRV
jgi:hypothetical protein